ncbi:hypothetical protein [uncultured Rikenella sp.]|uniref:hypothetical protein n=1 Tax=uncultured Rikenella sp. TaxID=368003 RepID=UPI00262DAA4B|nr:hypothetical protein [uncultured Rikenella sp.]
MAAPGYRHNLAGSLLSIGEQGYSWSSSASDTNGLNLGFGGTWFRFSSSDGRAYGFQLRCLSE